MLRPQLVKWQWEGYPLYHKNKMNLVIHIIFVPLFAFAGIAALIGLFQLNMGFFIASLIVMVFSFAMQGIGHKREKEVSIPFLSPADFVSRILVEHYVNFPRYVLSGKYFKAWKQL